MGTKFLGGSGDCFKKQYQIRCRRFIDSCGGAAGFLRAYPLVSGLRDYGQTIKTVAMWRQRGIPAHYLFLYMEEMKELVDDEYYDWLRSGNSIRISERVAAKEVLKVDA